MKKNYLNIIIVVFAISTLIPIICGNYISLNDTLVMASKYFLVISIYFGTIIVTNKFKNGKNILINLIIAFSIIFIILGIDKMTFKVFGKLYEVLDVSFVSNSARMDSVFGYPNIFAINTYISLFLLIGKIFSEKRIKYKILELLLICIHLIAIFLSGSRLVLILTVLFGIIFLGFKFKDNAKKLSKVMIIFIIALAILITILLNIKSDLVLFEKNSEIDTYSKKEIPVEPDKDNTISLELEAIGSVDTTKREYGIIIKQLDKNNNTISNVSNKFGTYNGKLDLNFRTDVNAKYINIIFSCSQITDYTKLTIKRISLNNKELTVNYKFLPIELVDRIVYSSFTSNSIVERFTIFLDGIKIIEKEPSTLFFGQGGNTWKYRFNEVIDYDYDVPQVHNFPLQLVLESGILTCLVYLMIMLFTIKNIYKIEKNSFNLGIICAFLGVLIHSCMDYELDSIIILAQFFILIAFLQDERKKKKKKNVKYIVCITTAISILLSAIVIINKYDVQEAIKNSYTKLGEEQNILALEKVIKREKYFQYDIYTLYLYNIISSNNNEYSGKIQNCYNTIKSNIKEDKILEDFDRAVEVLEKGE